MVIWELNVKFFHTVVVVQPELDLLFKLASKYCELFGLSMRIISNLRTSLMVHTLYALEILCGRKRDTKMHNILLSFSFSHRAML